MIGVKEVRDLLAEVFLGAGIAGGRSIWRFDGADAIWLIELDRLPFGHRVALDLGLNPSIIGGAPRRPTDCPILLGAEHLPFVNRQEVIAATELESTFDNDSRRDVISRLAAEIVEYIAARQTLDDIRNAYKAGEFVAAFIRKDARVVLEG